MGFPIARMRLMFLLISLGASQALAAPETQFVFRWFGIPIGEAIFHYQDLQEPPAFEYDSQIRADEPNGNRCLVVSNDPALPDAGRRLEELAIDDIAVSDTSFLAIEPPGHWYGLSIILRSYGIVRWLRSYRAIVRQSTLPCGFNVFQSLALDRGVREVRLIRFGSGPASLPKVFGFIDRNQVDPLRITAVGIGWTSPIDVLSTILDQARNGPILPQRLKVFDGKRAYEASVEEVKDSVTRDVGFCSEAKHSESGDVETCADRMDGLADVPLRFSNEVLSLRGERLIRHLRIEITPISASLDMPREVHEQEPMSEKLALNEGLDALENGHLVSSMKLWPFNQATLSADLWIATDIDYSMYSRIEVETPFGKIVGSPSVEASKPD